MTTSRLARRCELPFPAKRVLLDTSALLRFWNLDSFAALSQGPPVVVASVVKKEFSRRGPAQRAALDSLYPEIVPVRLGSPEGNEYDRLRGGERSLRHAGEHESIALAIVRAREGERLPFVTFDRDAFRLAHDNRVPKLDFLDTLAWLVGCEVLTLEKANELEVQASAVDGWRRPPGYGGNIELERVQRQRHEPGLFAVRL